VAEAIFCSEAIFVNEKSGGRFLEAFDLIYEILLPPGVPALESD